MRSIEMRGAVVTLYRKSGTAVGRDYYQLWRHYWQLSSRDHMIRPFLCLYLYYCPSSL